MTSSSLLCPHCGSGGAHEADCPALAPPGCRTFWGSHGCALPRDHPDGDQRHQCGLTDDEDGPCSQVTWELDPLTGTEHWVWRFADASGDGWDGQAFPVALFGPDAPANAGTQAEADQVRQVWTDAGKLARFVEGRGWVYEKAEGAP